MKLLQLSRAFAARILGASGRRIDERLRLFKEKLFEGLTGNVVEIGPGSGVNFQYFPRNVNYVGIEPNNAFHPTILDAAKKRGMYSVEMKEGFAERLPFASESQDAVVSGMVLCSVKDPRAALQEIKRVLKDHGTFYFVEHVVAPPKTVRRMLQKLIKPFCLWCGDGCHPDRDTLETIRKAGFGIIVTRTHKIPTLPVALFIIGKAIK